jgi:hypothetical protein
MVSDASVKDFVRKKLGCDCDEEVFNYIKNEKDVSAGNVRLRNRINIGNRLLVYIMEGNAGNLDKIAAVVRAGKGDRDTNAFNRFRLVFVTDDKGLKKTADDMFKAIPGLDDKVHFHVMGKNDVTGL